MQECQSLCSVPELKESYIIKGLNGQGVTYADGFKKCTTCMISLVCEKRTCPCCGTALRWKPREQGKSRCRDREQERCGVVRL